MHSPSVAGSLTHSPFDAPREQWVRHEHGWPLSELAGWMQLLCATPCLSFGDGREKKELVSELAFLAQSVSGARIHSQSAQGASRSTPSSSAHTIPQSRFIQVISRYYPDNILEYPCSPCLNPSSSSPAHPSAYRPTLPCILTADHLSS